MRRMIFSREIALRTGYNNTRELAVDVLRHTLPIRPSGPKTVRENWYEIPALVRAILLGRLRALKVPVARTTYYLEMANDEEIEDAVRKLWADVVERVWAVLPAELTDPSWRCFRTSEMDLHAALNQDAAILFDLTDELRSMIMKGPKQ